VTAASSDSLFWRSISGGLVVCELCDRQVGRNALAKAAHLRGKDHLARLAARRQARLIELKAIGERAAARRARTP